MVYRNQLCLLEINLSGPITIDKTYLSGNLRDSINVKASPKSPISIKQTTLQCFGSISSLASLLLYITAKWNYFKIYVKT